MYIPRLTEKGSFSFRFFKYQFEIGSQVSQAGLELLIVLALPPELLGSQAPRSIIFSQATILSSVDLHLSCLLGSKSTCYNGTHLWPQPLGSRDRKIRCLEIPLVRKHGTGQVQGHICMTVIMKMG